jgi:hypothetical protein
MSQENSAQIVGETVNIQDGGAFMVSGQTVSIKDGGAAIITGQNVSVTDGGSGLLIANNVEMTDGGAMFLLAGEVSGDVRVMFDIKAAIIFGTLVGAIIGVFKFVLGQR